MEKNNLKIGYFRHWTQPEYKFVDFLKEQGFDPIQIDFSQKDYLAGLDVVLIEQNGFNDYIENDEEYIHNYVKNGGILTFMHQSYERWAPYFLPRDVGYTQLIHRHVRAIGGIRPFETFTNDTTYTRTYMMPWIENEGKKLFSYPNEISPDEFLDWRLLTATTDEKRTVAEHRTSALSCYLLNENWQILGSYQDPAVRDGALIAKAPYGKGMFFLNQIIFPDKLNGSETRCLDFWKKYVVNLFDYFKRFKNNESEKIDEKPKKLALKKNYKLAIHMHSLDWYGCDSSLGQIHALMKYMGIDISAISVKDSAPFHDNLDLDKYNDDKVLFLHGQEYHPFNWKDKYDSVSHNTYHLLAIGVDESSYTNRFTRSLYGDEEIKNYINEAVDYIHKNNGVVCATHPFSPYWLDYNFDGVDIEPLRRLSGTPHEQFWLNGGKTAMMVSVDLFGFRRILDNPAFNFIYLKGAEPNRESVCDAIRNHNVIAATGFSEADITIGDYVPGDVIPVETAKRGTLSIRAKTLFSEPIREVRVYSADKLIYTKNGFEKDEIELKIDLKGYDLEKFVRVEIEAKDEFWICTTTPFFLE